MLLLCGCGGDSKPKVAEGPTTVEALTSETASNAIVEDIAAVRTASDSGQADDAIMALFDLVGSASEEGSEQAAETIRDELPGLVAQLDAAAPGALARLSELELQTDEGGRIRGVVMELVRGQTKDFDDLEQDVAAGKPTREALARWKAKNGALSGRLRAELEAVVNGLPADQREAVRLAVYKFFAR